MHIQRKRYTAEFKMEAVQLAQELGNVAETARDLDIHESVLHRWKRQLAEYGDEAFPGNGQLRSEADTIRQLRRENEILRQEREVLKKTLSIFAQPRPEKGGRETARGVRLAMTYSRMQFPTYYHRRWRA